MTVLFHDRRDAGSQLAERLDHLRGPDAAPVVAALVRGGVPVADEVARSLEAPLEILVVRKVGAPSNPEFGIGAIAEGGHTVQSPRALALTNVDTAHFEELARREQDEVERRVRAYRGDRPRVPFDGRPVVVVDDGLATGVTARVAAEAVRALGAARVVVAVPVGAPDSVRMLEEAADEVVVLHAPADFRAVGSWYANFGQTSDEEVVEILAAAHERSPGD